MRVVKLNGVWKAWPAKKGPLSREFYKDPNLANSWYDIKVPGNWQTQSDYSEKENTLYYFCAFQAPFLEQNQGVIFEISNVFNEFELWINGEYVGSADSYFVAYKQNITKVLNHGDNYLYLKVTWPASNDLHKHEMLGVYGEWEFKDENIIPGGICGDVKLRVVDDIYLNEVMVDYTFKQRDVIDVSLRINLSSTYDTSVMFDWLVEPYNFSGESLRGSTSRDIKKGNSYIKLNFNVNRPALWNPWEQGEPSLYKLSLKICHDDIERDEDSIIVGFRNIEEKNGSVYINGKRQFLRGVLYAPNNVYFAEITKEDYEKDVQLMLDAGFNTVRLFQHVPSQDLYDICNENGLLVWQDIPYNYSSKTKSKNNVLRKTVHLYNRLHSNPSLIIWGKPSKADIKTFKINLGKLYGGTVTSKIARTLKKIDKNRIVVENKKYFNFFRMFDKRYFLSPHGDEYRMAFERITISRGKTKFISSYGFPAYPEIATMIEIASNVDSEDKRNWLGSKNVNSVYYDRLEQWLPVDEYDRSAAYYMASQNLQARLLRYYHELFRRYKYRPYGGCFVYFFVDNSLAITDSIVDYYRRPKQGYTATRRAMQPICVLMDWPNDYYTDGDIIKLQTYVINDTHMAFPSTVLRWKIYNNEHEIFISDKKIVDMLGDDKITAGLIKWEITKNIDPGDYYVKLELELSTQECVENNYILKIIN